MKDNDNNNSPAENLGVWNNPELEARLVALLMGELSPYEEAEMALELAKSPELRLFRERMLEVKRLIAEVNTEDEDHQNEEDWTLSPERRSTLIENFNTDKPERIEPEIKSTASLQWRNVFSIAACLVISLAAFMMMFLSRSNLYKNLEPMVTYSAASEEGIEIVGGTSVVLPASKSDRRSDNLPQSYSETISFGYDDSFIKGEKEGKNGRDNTSIVAKPEMSNETGKKPSAPSSSMAKVIAATTPSPSLALTPVPQLKAKELSLEFGDGDDFGDGWGSGSGSGEGGIDSSKANYAWFAGAKLGGDVITDGNRSGDYAISRDSIDSFLITPNKSTELGLLTGERSFRQEEENQLLSGESTIRNGLIQAEVARRHSSISEADKAILRGRKAYQNKDYEEAVNQYRKSVTLLPQGQIAEERRKEYKSHLIDGSIALSQTYHRTGRYAESRELLDDVLEVDPGNVVAKKQLEYLDDPIRTSPTLTYKHVENVEKTRKLLYRAHSYYDQAQFDHATLEFKETLRIDPYNKAARRGLEKVNAAKSDYYRAAYDQTRSAMLMQVDQAWEIPVPPVEEAKKVNQAELAEARRKVKLLKLIQNNPEMKEVSDELFGSNIGMIAEINLKQAEKELGLIERKFDSVSGAIPSVEDRSVIQGMDQKKLAKIEKFKEKRRIQEDKVEDHRTRLYALSKKLKIPYHGKDGRFYAGRDADGNESQRATQAYEEAKRTKDQLESFTNSLNGLNDEDLQVTLLASGRPEAAVIKTDFDRLNQLKQNKSVALASGIGGEHRTIESLDVSIKALEDRLGRSTINVRKKLSEDLVVFNQNVEKLRIDTDKEAGDLMVSAEEKTRFGKVREDYEREQAILDAIKQAEFSETLGEGLEREVMPAKEFIPEKTAPDFTKEISAAKTTHSTFSLNVSDVSYQLAKSVLLEKGGMPEAAKIRVEEFVNAFDYGDPSASNASGKKVNCVVEQCAHPFYQQRNLMRIGMKTGAMGRSQPLRLTVLLDNSGSMERADRAATVAKAIEALASQLEPQDEVTLLSFARGARLVAQKVKGDKAHQLVNLVKTIPSEGGTNLSFAIEQAYTTAQQSIQDGTMSRIVLITDGAANLGNADPEELSKSIEKMRQNGIAFDACGVGADGLDDDMLEALTRKGDGRYYFINKPEDADAGFAQKLAGALRPAAKNVKVQVVFNPERVGNYRLVGFEKHRLKKQDFRNDAVDAAEMAAEEAGNALYQVEAKPDGRGDVGTVFVRFRDMATGQMVERSWVIPYEPSIKNLTSAKPSMQLATVAGMLGERLKQGEEAGIELNQLRPIYGKLRSHFHADKEVKDLLRMCEKVNQ